MSGVSSAALGTSLYPTVTWMLPVVVWGFRRNLCANSRSMSSAESVTDSIITGLANVTLLWPSAGTANLYVVPSMATSATGSTARLEVSCMRDTGYPGPVNVDEYPPVWGTVTVSVSEPVIVRMSIAADLAPSGSDSGSRVIVAGGPSA